MTTKSNTTRGNMVSDLIAGLTTGVANIPDALASSVLAGVNPVQGLYAVMVGTPLGAIFSSSAYMNVAANERTGDHSRIGNRRLQQWRSARYCHHHIGAADRLDHGDRRLAAPGATVALHFQLGGDWLSDRRLHQCYPFANRRFHWLLERVLQQSRQGGGYAAPFRSDRFPDYCYWFADGGCDFAGGSHQAAQFFDVVWDGCGHRHVVTSGLDWGTAGERYCNDPKLIADAKIAQFISDPRPVAGCSRPCDHRLDPGRGRQQGLPQPGRRLPG